MLMGCLLLGVSSCNKEDDYFKRPEEMKARMFERLQQDPDLSTFVQAVEKAGLADILNRSGLYTAFAPTNAAFDEYFRTSGYASLDAVPDSTLKELVDYHLLVPMKFSFDFSGEVRYPTRAFKYASINRTTDAFTIDDANVITGKMDREAMNGAIHGIDKVLRPQPGLNQFADLRPELSTFAAVLDTFTLRRYDAENSSDVDGDGVIDSVFTEESLLELEWRDQEKLFTVFAPTNASFAAFLATQPQYKTLGDVPRPVLEYIINYHLLEGAKRAAELGGAIETLGGESLTLPAGAVITPDVPLSNGVLHVTNTLFVPPSLGTVAGLVLLNPGGDLGKFGQAMQKAALADDFMDPAKQFTFFAPTDAAFAAAGIDLDKATPAELEKIVRYHVVNGKLMQANLPNGPLTTHQGSTVNVSGTTLTDAKGKTANLVQTDQTASNGVLHKINQVLSPAN